MSEDFLTELLEAILHEQGVEDARGVAQRAAADLRKARVVDDRMMEILERNRRIYNLRAVAGVSEALVAQRFGLKPRMVRYIVRRQILSRRIA